MIKFNLSKLLVVSAVVFILGFSIHAIAGPGMGYGRGMGYGYEMGDGPGMGYGPGRGYGCGMGFGRGMGRGFGGYANRPDLSEEEIQKLDAQRNAF